MNTIIIEINPKYNHSLDPRSNLARPRYLQRLEQSHKTERIGGWKPCWKCSTPKFVILPHILYRPFSMTWCGWIL